MKPIPSLLSCQALRDLLRGASKKISLIEADIGKQFEKEFQQSVDSNTKSSLQSHVSVLYFSSCQWTSSSCSLFRSIRMYNANQIDSTWSAWDQMFWRISFTFGRFQSGSHRSLRSFTDGFLWIEPCLVAFQSKFVFFVDFLFLFGSSTFLDLWRS